jgi:site-specific recombinase XerD
MLDFFFTKRLTLADLRSGPAGVHLDGYAAILHGEGYARISGQRLLRSAAHLGVFAETEADGLGSMDENTLAEFESHRSFCRCSGFNGENKWHNQRGAGLFVKHLCNIGVVQGQVTRDDRAAVVRSFEEFLRRHRGVAETTIDRYSRAAIQVVDTLGDDPSQYDAASLRSFVVDRARHSGFAAMKLFLSGARSFLRYLVCEGLCRPGLDEAMPSIARRRLVKIPRSPTPTQVEQIISSCDLGSLIGIRNRAIILLLARLGLRVSDVAALRLTDVDWEDGSFVVSGKGRYEVRLPLPQDVGDAILNYLELRPPVPTDHVFIKVYAPLRSLCPSSVAGAVAETMRWAGLSGRFCAHSLRHAAATQMLRQGASLFEIGAVLRHRSIDTSAYYAKVDLDLLNQVTQPWPVVL